MLKKLAMALAAISLFVAPMTSLAESGGGKKGDSKCCCVPKCECKDCKCSSDGKCCGKDCTCDKCSPECGCKKK